MASSRSSASSSRRTKLTKSTNPTDVSSKARRSSAYDDDFEQHLIDYNVYLEGYEYPNDRETPGWKSPIHQLRIANRGSHGQRFRISSTGLGPETLTNP
ncbi:hypothetical protein B0T25DRAFT_57027 [Lasiosphaeria hispida]|uniref:Uncharacterized protein n=1 Tax=Lasiosphaeria hispida TaxID=260671 RepID=A0AAJ0HW59_9PEZI|nr:hypothetical protein B0T25DRAFT_57027 [Lasiosphaeria hispida]